MKRNSAASRQARKGSLKQARVILLIVGVLSLVVNLVLALNAEKMVENAIEEEQRKARGVFVVDPAKKEEIVRLNRLINGGFAAVGAVFIILGIAVYAAPVACTVTGLVLYLGCIAVAGALEPETLIRGFIIKIVIIVLLVKSIQAASEYEREAKADQYGRRRPRGGYDDGGDDRDEDEDRRRRDEEYDAGDRDRDRDRYE